jgi:hypothetical protein
MRTKTLLLAAALSAAGLATSLAQSNVYSLNVVGYINVAVDSTPLAVTLIAPSQLDFDGTGLNNTVLTTFGNGQNGGLYATGTKLFAFDPNTAGYVQVPFINPSGWVPGAALTSVTALGLKPGSGVFYQTSPTGGPTNITFVGNVLQGSLVNTPFVGLNITSSKVPQAGRIETDLGLSVPADNVTPFVAVWRHRGWDVNAGAGQYHQFQKGASGWLGTSPTGGEPSVSVGEAWFLRAKAGATWTRNFTVQ